MIAAHIRGITKRKKFVIVITNFVHILDQYDFVRLIVKHAFMCSWDTVLSNFVHIYTQYRLRPVETIITQQKCMPNIWYSKKHSEIMMQRNMSNETRQFYSNTKKCNLIRDDQVLGSAFIRDWCYYSRDRHIKSQDYHRTSIGRGEPGRKTTSIVNWLRYNGIDKWGYILGLDRTPPVLTLLPHEKFEFGFGLLAYLYIPTLDCFSGPHSLAAAAPSCASGDYGTVYGNTVSLPEAVSLSRGLVRASRPWRWDPRK